MSLSKRIILIFSIALLSLLFVSCGFTSSSSRSNSGIASITTEVVDDTTYLVITYEDKDKEPERFAIPSGKDGTGIQTIVVKDNETGTGKTVSIYLTGQTDPEVSFDVSNGISVTGITSELDEETGTTYVYVNYSDGTISDPIAIPKGEKGEGLVGCTTVENEDGSQTVTLEFTNSSYDITIPAQKEARGIDYIMGSTNTETNEYVLTIYYTDGTSEEVSFDGPEQPSVWLSGITTPTDDLGKDGDFYYNTQNSRIYSKVDGRWTLIASLGGGTNYCIVSFTLIDPDTTDDIDPSLISGSTQSLMYEVLANTYFTQNGYSIPIPVYPGYTFKGWYTSREINPTLGAFTDLTPILTNLTLYSIWEKNA